MRRRAAVRRRLARLTTVPAARGPSLTTVITTTRPAVVLVVGAAAATGVAGALGGPVAAVIGGWYAVLGLRALRRAAAQRSVTAARTSTLDIIGGLAADLRAGAAAPATVDAARAALSALATSPAGRGGGPDVAIQRATGRLSAAYEVSERLGAPLADLLDRVESDLRGVERTRAAVTAQTTGARASAALLALLPVAGIGLGYAMGARPGHALLHTPLGAGCALAALVLQCGGLGWTGRLCRAAVERAS
jgi:tight adherence protein B